MLTALTALPSPQIAEVFDDEAVRIFLEFERVESAIKGQWRPADNKVLLQPPPPREARFSLLCLLGSREVGAAPSASPNYCVTALIILMGSAQIGNQVRLGSPRRYITRGPGNLAASPQRPSGAYITDSQKKQDRHSESGAVSNGDGAA